MTPPPPPRTPKSGLVLLLFALPCGLAAWYLLQRGNAEAHLIPWSCWGGECSTDDPRVFLIIGGVAANIACFAFALAALRAIAFGAAMALGPLASISGWREAVAGGLPAAEVSTEIKVWGAVAGVGAVIALLGLVYELRVSAAFAALLGRERVPAALEDYKDAGSGSGVGTAALAFRDRRGHPHRVEVRVPRSWTRAPLAAVYPAGDPARARAALPWLRRLITAETVASTVSAETGAPASEPSLVGELERLAALRREGHLTEEEFQLAKRRLLEP
ncbi:SHOCT domain-containing protein [Glycomyces sp. A-F 0318]|uniref:SHOCT domain-containing protein n=1 Tax=Glycomyces amatae TaxID=2881355 RepID=UPI001E4B261C|nr:SHOCT domain-containing protein [Glycomyces amatae]MCD0443203.1 SHOCT domain-containing protein [Glycomyces amatae]